MTKRSEPCRSFTSADPGAGAHWPDPCETCGWSQPNHDAYWEARDLKNDILSAVNKVLDGTGLSIARATVDGCDTYHLIRVPQLEKP